MLVELGYRSIKRSFIERANSEVLVERQRNHCAGLCSSLCYGAYLEVEHAMVNHWLGGVPSLEK